MAHKKTIDRLFDALEENEFEIKRLRKSDKPRDFKLLHDIRLRNRAFRKSIHLLSRPKTVIVDVIGGVANPWQIPEAVIVEVRDYDNGEAAPADDPSLRTDKDGNRYCVAHFSEGDTK